MLKAPVRKLENFFHLLQVNFIGREAQWNFWLVGTPYHSFGMRKGIERVFAMISAHPAGTTPAKGQFRADKLTENIIHTTPAEGKAGDDLLLHRAIAGKRI